MGQHWKAKTGVEQQNKAQKKLLISWETINKKNNPNPSPNPNFNYNLDLNPSPNLRFGL